MLRITGNNLWITFSKKEDLTEKTLKKRGLVFGDYPHIPMDKIVYDFKKCVDKWRNAYIAWL